MLQAFAAGLAQLHFEKEQAIEAKAESDDKPGSFGNFRTLRVSQVANDKSDY